jgi:hypothetical protein
MATLHRLLSAAPPALLVLALLLAPTADAQRVSAPAVSGASATEGPRALRDVVGAAAPELPADRADALARAVAGAASAGVRAFPAGSEETEAQKLMSNEAGLDLVGVGSSVAVSGDVAVVGMGRTSSGGRFVGAGRRFAAVFRYDAAAGTWSLEQQLVDPTGATEYSFATSVAVSDGVVVVGAFAGPDGNAAHVYRYDGSAAPGSRWVEEQRLTASDAADGDGFGYSVAVSGGAVLVGAPFNDDAGDASGSAYVFRYDGGAGVWTEEQKLTASDAYQLDQFGYSVAVSGGVAVVGAPLTNAGHWPRSAYVFRYDGGAGAWTEEEQLSPSDGELHDQFGVSVAVSDGVVVVGAPYSESPTVGSDFGAAYVFRYDSGTGAWSQEQKLAASLRTRNDHFGSAVAVSGGVVVVGAPRYENGGRSDGAAYVFRYDAGTWAQEQRLAGPPQPSGGVDNDDFGGAVAISGGVALVGAPLYNLSNFGPEPGVAFVVRYDGSAAPGSRWAVGQRLALSDGAALDRFGWSVAVSGGVAAAGAIYADGPGGTEAGAAYVFRYDGGAGTWGLEQRLVAPDGAAGDHFGTSVAVLGDVVLVGAPAADAVGSNSGAVYAFRYDGMAAPGGRWALSQRLTPSDAAANIGFGSSVAASDGVAVVGAPSASGGGAAYVFRYDEGTGAWAERQRLGAPTNPGGRTFGESVAVSGDVVVVGKPADHTGGTSRGSAYVFRYSTGTGGWSEEQRLVASDGAAQDRLGEAVGVSGDVVVVGAPARSVPPTFSRSGSAYVFRYGAQAGAWAEEQRLTYPGADPQGDFLTNGFGESVAVSGEIVLVGASEEDAGAAHVFRHDGAAVPGSQWAREPTLTASDGADYDALGSSLAISGGVVLVGAPFDDDAGRSSGTASVFHLAGVTGAEPGPEAGEGLTVEAYPNPTRGAFTVRFALPEASLARVVLCDALGREVAVLREGLGAEGWNEVSMSERLPPGVYLVRIEAMRGVSMRTLTVVR